MKIATKILFGAFLVVAILVASAGAWLYFDKSGLPDVRSMSDLAHPTTPTAPVPCLTKSIAVPYESLGSNIRNALSAIEVPEDGPSVAMALFKPKARISPAMHLSRQILCKEEKPLEYDLDQVRTAIQLQRMYSNRELFTMVANTAYFGEDTVGVEAASQHYFRKHAADLSIAESALLAGLVSRPNYYSPSKHPDRALLRRNQVIDIMAHKGMMSADDAAKAKATPLLAPMT